MRATGLWVAASRFFAVLNLYYIVGSIALAWQLIEHLPDFDKGLIPQSVPPAGMAAVPQPEQINALTTEAAEAAAEAVGGALDGPNRPRYRRSRL